MLESNITETTQNDSAYELIEENARKLFKEEKYKKLKRLMDSVLKTRESSYCYRLRALAITNLHPSNIEQYYMALNDIDKALELEYCENNLSAKLYVLHWALVAIDLWFFGDPSPLLDYEHEKIALPNLNYENSEEDERFFIQEIIAVLDKLIEMNPLAKYYGSRAQYRFKYFRAIENENTEIFNMALKDISIGIDLEPTSEMYYFKVKIEKALGLFEEAISTLDVILALYPPSNLDSDSLLSVTKGNAYLSKLELLIKLENYDQYAFFLKDLIDKGISMMLSDHLSVLIDKKQSPILFKYFKSPDNPGAVILWFNICAHIANNDLPSARKLLAGFSFEELVKESFQPLSSMDETSLRFEQTEEYRLKTLFSAISFENMSMLFFIDLLEKLYYNDISKESIADKYLAIIAAGQDNFNSPLENYSFKFRNFESSIADHPLDETEIKLELLYSLPFEESEKIQGFSLIKHRIEQELIKAIMLKNAVRIERAKVDERNRILSNLSHSIKNMLRSVIDPLINLREEFPQKANVIDNAIKGANLIREIVNSINHSYKTDIEDIGWDIAHPDAESMTLQEMLLNSLKYSLANMFECGYFPQYFRNYYPRSIAKGDFESIKAEWTAVSSVNDFEPLIAFAEKHICKLSIILSEASQYKLGNEKSSAIKLMIMFQEIIFNAVKYASFVPRDQRFLEIRLDSTETTIKLEVSNSYRPEVQAKTTGVGKFVIENFSKVLGSIPELKTTDTTYSISIEFNNLWRNNAKNTVH